MLNEFVVSHFRGRYSRKKLLPDVGDSAHYKHWISVKDLKRCVPCKENHSMIWPIKEEPEPKPPLHPFCRCQIKTMETIAAGTATINGISGADWTLKFDGKLPEYYIQRDDAIQNGWKPGKAFSHFMPNKTLTMGEYFNRNKHLPVADGRAWYEADINYISGKRNKQRILWSNDGLLFVTYDHYETFYEIV